MILAVLKSRLQRIHVHEYNDDDDDDDDNNNSNNDNDNDDNVNVIVVVVVIVVVAYEKRAPPYVGMGPRHRMVNPALAALLSTGEVNFIVGLTTA